MIREFPSTIDPSIVCRDCPGVFGDIADLDDHLISTAAAGDPHWYGDGVEPINPIVQAAHDAAVTAAEHRQRLIDKLATVTGLSAEEVLDVLKSI